MCDSDRLSNCQATACTDLPHLDVSGLHCPIPLIHCLATLHRMAPGSHLRVTVSNRDALHDIALLLRRGPHRLLDWWQDDNGSCHFVIRKNGTTRPRIHAGVALLLWLRQHLGLPKLARPAAAPR